MFEGLDEVEIKPKFYRDGFYYNRLEQIAWVEYGGKAFLYKPSLFLYELNLANHIPLSPKEREAIKFLYNRSLKSKKLKKLFDLDSDWKNLRNIRYNTLLHLS